MEILTLTHKHTNSFLIQGDNGCIMYDAGWADSFSVFMEQIKKHGKKLSDIKYLVVSHFHPDHAGLVQILNDYGVKFLLHEQQEGAYNWLNSFFSRKPSKSFKPIVGGLKITTKESRQILKNIGINGEIISTLGHSEDGVSLIIDGKCAFTGDLPRLEYALNDPLTQESYRKILALGVSVIYPAHGSSFNV